MQATNFDAMVNNGFDESKILDLNFFPNIFFCMKLSKEEDGFMDVFLVFGMVVFHAFSKELAYTPLGKTSIHVQLDPTSLAKLVKGKKLI